MSESLRRFDLYDIGNSEEVFAKLHYLLEDLKTCGAYEYTWDELDVLWRFLRAFVGNTKTAEQCLHYLEEAMTYRKETEMYQKQGCANCDNCVSHCGAHT